MHTAIFEQWSETLSRFVSRSERTNPISIVHSFFLRRVTCCFLIKDWRLSTTCSSGSTLYAFSRSFSTNAPSARESISLTADIMVVISDLACSENSIFFSFISSADSRMLTAWSLIRSKSPIIWSSFETSRLSSSVSVFPLTFTRYVPKASSYLSAAFSPFLIFLARSSLKSKRFARESLRMSTEICAMSHVTFRLLSMATAGVERSLSSRSSFLSFSEASSLMILYESFSSCFVNGIRSPRARSLNTVWTIAIPRGVAAFSTKLNWKMLSSV